MAIGKALICCYLVFASILVGWTAGQKRTKVGTSIAGSEIEMAPDFECPEEFGYYPAPYDCTRYYVCVFGGALLESCTGGLVYSHELQTCDWPRNVGCLTGAEAMAINAHKTSSRTSTTDSKSNSPLTQFLSSDSNKPTTSRSQSSTAAINARSKTPLTFELLGDVAATIDNRQGRDFQGTTPLRSQGPNAPIGGTSKNTLAGESTKPSSFNSRSQAPRAEDLPEDFIAATTFNPTVRIPHRTPVDSRVPTGASLSSNDQFHRETTGTRQPTTESSSNGDSTDQWEAPVPQRGQRPSAPPRQSSQTERTVSTTTTERPTRPPVQTTHQFSEPDVDYHGFPVDEFATSEPTVDQFADYDIFEDPATTGGRPQEEEFLPPVTRAVPTTTTTTSTTTTTTTTTTTPKPVQRGSNRGKPAGDRGSSRFRPSDSNREEESAPASATVPKRRPTLKPVSDLVRNPVAEPIDIMQHPPRRLEPIFPQPTPDEPAARHSFGEQMSAKKWAKEAAGQRDIMAAYGGVRAEDIRGLRAPFLSVGGNRMFKMLYDLNFTYDSSMPVYENKPPSWPYTLDYKIFHDCMIPPCPTKSYPGVWEVPMVMWQDLNGGRCSMGDGCSNPPDAEGVYKMLIKNFERHYTTNRAPFPLYYHAAWFTTAHHKEGFEAFLDTIVSMDDVWLVTNWQAIQWVRDPTPLDRIKSFKPFNCDYPERPKRCNASKVCNAWHKSGVRYMRTCQPCPEVFPWTGKTGVRNPFLDNYGDNEVATA
ncbi:putative Chitin deacetylase 5 [Daphnia magna]|uniref:Putative Chitin deacetylase 5 n=1 Tax=Daphnia magna TaxID=35525 RepID=A0A162SH71_9CRUS|nr:putative Chitin deacetylase 5 [Daphnia magna]